jgi:shikimate dehydrogenase
LEFNNPAISGKTFVYGLIGDPIDHSLSPTIQNAGFRANRINAVYVPFRVTTHDLKTAIRGLRVMRVCGFNVTTPHKVNVISYLDKIVGAASEIGSVNTVVSENGKLCGYNTDGIGALNSLAEAGVAIEGKSALILGAGGASKAVAYSFGEKARSVRLVNRTVNKAKRLAKQLGDKRSAEFSFSALSSRSLRTFVEEADIIVNASSMGMHGKANPPMRAKWLRPGQCVLDLVYTPPRTKLLDLAVSAGANIITGFDMLVNQGASSFKLWTGQDAPLVEMRNAMAQTLRLKHAESG